MKPQILDAHACTWLGKISLLSECLDTKVYLLYFALGAYCLTKAIRIHGKKLREDNYRKLL